MHRPLLWLLNVLRTGKRRQPPCRAAAMACQTPLPGRNPGSGADNPQDIRCGRAGVLRRGINRCGAAATLLAAAILAGPPAPASAQIPADVQTGGRPTLDTSPPEPAAAMGLYNAVDGWVRA